jgi:hypothetical protein
MKADNQKPPHIFQSGCLRLGLVIFFCSLTQLTPYYLGGIYSLPFITAEDGSSCDSRINYSSVSCGNLLYGTCLAARGSAMMESAQTGHR